MMITNFPNCKLKFNSNITSNKNAEKPSAKINIGYINDFHGQLTKMERTILPLQHCDIRLSGGDSFLGEDKSINIGVAKFLNLAGYEATALGNHEVDMDEDSFYEITKGLKTKFLNQNYHQIKMSDAKEQQKIYDETNKAPISERFSNAYIKEINGEKYGLMGVAPIDIDIRRANPENYNDCKIDSLDETIQNVQKTVDEFKKQGIDKIILLSHLGYKIDKQLAQATSGIDIIVGGHSHDLVKSITKGENLLYSKNNEPVIITNAGKDGQYFGNLKVEFDNNGIIKSAQNNVISTSNYQRNLIYKQIIESHMTNNEEVGYIKSVLPEPTNRLIEENPQANFIADAMKNELGVEIAFLNNANTRSTFEPGKFTKLDAKMISPFNNKMIIANVTEKDIVDALKHAAKSLINTRPGLMAVSGLKYSVRKSDGELLSMSKVNDNGTETPININNPSTTKTYKIAADSFLMAGRDGFVSLDYKGKEEKILDFDKDKLVCDYIKHLNKPIEINQTGRINFV